MAVPPNTWRGERSLRGVQSQVQAAINQCDDGAIVNIDVKTARTLIEIIEQARHTEGNQEIPYGCNRIAAQR